MFIEKKRNGMAGRAGFTLVELVMTIAIALLIIGVVSMGVRRIPALVTLDQCVNDIKSIFVEASTRAVVNGKNSEITFNLASRQFSLSGGGDDLTRGESAKTLPEEMEFEFPDARGNPDVAHFFFFPDGSADGPIMDLKLRGHAARLTLSRLSGILNVDYGQEK